MLGVVIQIDGYDPIAGANVSLFAASHDDPAVCHLNNGQWWPAIAKLPTLRYDLFDGAFGNQITAPSSSMSLAIEPWPNFARYSLADARFRLWTGEVGDAWGSWTLRFDGRVSQQPTVQDQRAQIEFAVDDRWLDAPLLTTYAGTTGAEGPAAMKGQTKPLSLGAPRYVAGKLIDSVNSVFQVSAYGPIEGFEAALERLVRFQAPVANYSTYAALVAATIPPGAWATANAVGMARFGAPTTGQISFLVKGDNGGPNAWARKPGQVIRRIALLSGGAGKIDDASLNALDIACPYNVSIQQDDQTTARELIQSLAASINAVAGVTWTGQLFVAPITLPAAFTFGGSLAGATLTRATTATRYDATGLIVSAATNTARFDYNPSTLALRGLLVEPARANLVLQSVSLSTTPWTSSGSITVTGGQPSPDGSNGFTLADTDTVSPAFRQQAITVAAGSTYTISGYITKDAIGRATRAPMIRLFMSGANTSAFLVIETSTGEIALTTGSTFTPTAYGVIDMGGYWRWYAVVVAPGTSVNCAIYPVWGNTTGPLAAIAQGVALTGSITCSAFQLELGATATSYISTAASAVTRAADVLVLPGQPAGSVTVRYTFDDGSTQDVTATSSGGNITVPTTLNRPWIISAATIPVAGDTLAADGSNLPAVSSVQQIGIAPPWKKLAIGAERAWTVHALSDIAFTAPLIDLGLYDPLATYREGNIVELGDGSSWLYYSTTPSSGNTPATGSAYWSNRFPRTVPISGRLTNEAHVVAADSAGAVTSYSGATGLFQVFDGNTDVSASFTLSTVANPQALTVGYASQTYTVTAGLDPGEPSAILTIRASGSGAYAGFSVDKVFSLAKAVAGAGGAGGPAGSSNALVTVYQRAASAPAVPSASVTYTFATGGISGLNNGWSATIPGGPNPLYATTAVASAATATDSIATGEWATPVVIVQNGVDGAAGINAATVFLYQRNSTGTAPAVPASTTTYTFASSVLSGTLSGWTQSIPADSVGAYLWVTTATALGTGTTDTIATGEWATVRLLAQSGNYRDIKFIRSLAQPSTPTGATPSGWTDGVPSGTDTLWSSTATKSFNGVLLTTWSTPQSLSGLTPRGPYSAALTYYLNNTATYNGGSYIAVQDNFTAHGPSGTGQANAYWDVLAAPGDAGTPAVPPSGFVATISLTSGSAINLRTVADANGYTGASDATVTFNVPSGVTIRGSAGGGIGIDTGTWPTGHAIALTVVVQSGGIVDGGGGTGGSGDYGGGSAGGDAIYARVNLTGGVTINSGGTVRGGGGGGGAGVGVRNTPPGQPINYDDPVDGGGGGGGGAPNGPAGSGGFGENGGSSGSSGGAGTTSGGGSGGSGATSGAPGGTFATAGSSSFGSGGAAGFAVRKNGNTITVTNNGTMAGSAS